MGDYFITGYTGFCPEISDHIGYNYQNVTRDIIKVHPHLKTRLSSLRYPDRNDSHHQSNPHLKTRLLASSCCLDRDRMDSHRQREEMQCICPESECMPEYEQVSGSVPENVWRACGGDGQTCGEHSRVPLQAYSLSCSKWGSPCISPHCNEVYCPCLSRGSWRQQSYSCHDHGMVQPAIIYPQSVQQRSNGKYFEPCCISCARGGPCSGDDKSETSMSKRPMKKYRTPSVMDYRSGGVVPNYMGHIPGMQNSFGEPYAMAASRLLRRHFDDLSNREL